MTFDETLELSSLLTASAWARNDMAKREAVFHLMLDQAPGFAIAAGLNPLIESLENLEVQSKTIDHLAAQKDTAGQPLIDDEVLAKLAKFSFTGDLHAMPEGSLAFPGEPVLRVRGPALETELLRRLITDRITHSSTIATEVARLRLAAKGDLLHDADITAGANIYSSRAAYLGGCSATNRIAASRRHGIPLAGQLTSDWLPSFGDSPTAFATGAAALPGHCYLPVHTHSAIEDAKCVVEVARDSAIEGVLLHGTGLAEASRSLRTTLNRAGLKDLAIIAGGGFAPETIKELKTAKAKIDTWALHHLSPAPLHLSWRLGAIRNRDGTWSISGRSSHHPGGTLQVHRKFKDRKLVGDVVYDQELGGPAGKGLLVSIFSKGSLFYFSPSLDEMRQQSMNAVDGLGKKNIEVKLETRLERRSVKLTRQLEITDLD